MLVDGGLHCVVKEQERSKTKGKKSNNNNNNKKKKKKKKKAALFSTFFLLHHCHHHHHLLLLLVFICVFDVQAVVALKSRFNLSNMLDKKRKAPQRQQTTRQVHSRANAQIPDKHVSSKQGEPINSKGGKTTTTPLATRARRATAPVSLSSRLVSLFQCKHRPLMQAHGQIKDPKGEVGGGEG